MDTFFYNMIFTEAIISCTLLLLATIIGLVRQIKHSNTGATISSLSIVFAVALAKFPLCYAAYVTAESYGIISGIAVCVVFIAVIYCIAKLQNNEPRRASNTTIR